MQAVQLPQCALTGASTGSGRSVNTSPRKNQEPSLRSSRLVCLPIQPRPASRASAFSSTGALSVKARYPADPAAARQPPGEPRQPRAHDPVIVASERIARHVGARRVVEHGMRPRARRAAGSPCARSRRAACPARAPPAARAACRAAPCSPSRRGGRPRARRRAARHPVPGRHRRSRPSGSRARRPHSFTWRASAARSGYGRGGHVGLRGSARTAIIMSR